MKKALLCFIKIYQVFFSAGGVFSPRTAKICAFYPSCSEYARLALLRHGFFKGGWFSLKRIMRCHPWQKNHFDPI